MELHGTKETKDFLMRLPHRPEKYIALGLLYLFRAICGLQSTTGAHYGISSSMKIYRLTGGRDGIRTGQ
jgi:hypothetical protein